MQEKLFNAKDFIKLEKITFQKTKSFIKNFKLENNYRKSDHFACCCLNCKFAYEKTFQSINGLATKLKCTKLSLSNSNKTDIAKHNICNLYEESELEAKGE